MRDNFLPEVAEDYIKFFEADDAWLNDYYEVAQATEAMVRSKLGLNMGKALLYVADEANPSPMRDRVLYIKSFVHATQKSFFVKTVPAPWIADKVKGVFDGDN